MSGRRPLRRLALLALAVLALPAAGQPPPSATPPPDPQSRGGGWLAERWQHNARERTTAGIEAWEDQRFTEATVDLERAFALSTAVEGDPLPLLNAGTGRLGAGDPQSAARLLAGAAQAADLRLEAGLGRADVAAAAHYNLGNALFEQGDFGGAAEAFRQALRRTPSHADAKHNLELAQARLQQQQQQQQQSENRSSESEQDEQGEPGDSADRPQESQPEEESSESSEPDEEPSPEEADDEPAPGDESEQQRGDGSGQSAQDQQPEPSGESESESLTEPQPSESRLPGFEDQPDMDADQAAAILEAVENLERQRRRREAAQRARRIAGGKDW